MHQIKSDQHSPGHRNSRLRHRSQFLRFFSKSQMLRLEGVLVFRVQNEEGYPRLGITLKLDKKGRAADRNRIRRWIRGHFDRNRDRLGSWDYNFVISRKAVSQGDLLVLRNTFATPNLIDVALFQEKTKRDANRA